MIDPRQVTETSAYLRELATDLELESGARWTLSELADRLRELADRQLVALPPIDPQHDQVHHWTELSDHRLMREINADAWNLAAGIAVQRDRTAIRQLGGHQFPVGEDTS